MVVSMDPVAEAHLSCVVEFKVDCRQLRVLIRTLQGLRYQKYHEYTAGIRRSIWSTP